jgi:5-methyltetrahydropteroyltriglutamate--homocysteine methyltransferase
MNTIYRTDQVGRLAGIDAAFLNQHAPGPFKITMPSPSFVARRSWQRGISDKAYLRQEDLLRDVVAIVKGEMQALTANGVADLQLDEGFMRYVMADWRERIMKEGLDVAKALAEDIAADNEGYDAVKDKNVTVAMHLYRGSRPLLPDRATRP